MILLQNANQIFFVCSPILKLGKYFSLTAVNKYQYKMKKFDLKLILIFASIKMTSSADNQCGDIFIFDDIADFIKATLSVFLLHYRVH